MRLSALLRQGSTFAANKVSAHHSLRLRPLPAACRWHTSETSTSAPAPPTPNSSQTRSTPKRRMAARAASVPDVYMEGVDPEITAFQQHQKTAAKPSPAEQAKTLVNSATFAVLSTLSSKDVSAGFPFGSVIQIASDGQGRPIFAASSLAPHTKDLFANPACCLTLLAAGWKGPQEARLTLVGSVVVVNDQEKPEVRETFLKKHPDAFWVDFGDFSWFRLDDIKTGNLVPGFGGGYVIKPADYLSAEADPIAPVSARVCGHMNADHEADIINMVKHYTGLTVEKARMDTVDKLGSNVFVTREGAEISVRLPFLRPVSDAKALKDVIVEMSRTAKPKPSS